MSDDAAFTFLDACDCLVDARDFMELVSMAHRHRLDSDSKAVNAGTHAALQALERATDLLEQLRPALGMVVKHEVEAKP